MTRSLIALAGMSSALALAVPASAQEADVPVNQVIVYGDQACPPSTAEQIVVCVRQEDPFRIPTRLRQSESKQNEAWAERVAANRDVGATGPGSCSAVGPTGGAGCGIKEIEQAYAEKEGGSEVQMGKLVEQARAERLAEIDESARLEQERVETLEAQYEARRKAQEAGAADVDAAPLPTPPAN